MGAGLSVSLSLCLSVSLSLSLSLCCSLFLRVCVCFDDEDDSLYVDNDASICSEVEYSTVIGTSNRNEKSASKFAEFSCRNFL
jgi:hypothetical protein